MEEYKHGARYEGWKVNGMREGHGKFFYQDGGLYCGMWRENKMDGQGILYYCNGRPAYDGQWQADRFNGFGVLYNESPEESQQPFNYRDFNQVGGLWQRYEGQFVNDSKQGQGTLQLTNGEVFRGTFAEDNISGRGVFRTLSGREVQGFWRENRLV